MSSNMLKKYFVKALKTDPNNIVSKINAKTVPAASRRPQNRYASRITNVVELLFPISDFWPTIRANMEPDTIPRIDTGSGWAPNGLRKATGEPRECL